MQLTTQKSIKNALTIASTVLIGASVVQSADVSKTDVESTLLIYSEQNRVSAAEGAVSFSHAINEKHSFKGKFTFDALTGASPNGAAPSDKIQTYTRPSGRGSYTIEPGQIPLDDTFRDTRLAVNGVYTVDFSRLNKFFVGANLSGEHDYFSFGINGGFSRDFNNKNTNLLLSGSFSSDKIKPEGGVPTPLSILPPPSQNSSGDDESEGGSSETKNTVDMLIGVTQTLNRKTLFRTNYSRSHATGYLNDPYKILSLVEDENSTSPGEPVDFLYEKRPDKRTKQAVYSQIRRYLGNSTIDIAYRYFWDDWGLTSHTVDLFYQFDLHQGKTIEPHVRWYQQSAADFYKPTLIQNQPLPEFASADYRIGKFTALTFGMQYSFPIQPVGKLKLMAEYYTQFGDSSPPGIIGSQLKYDMFPTLKAFMFRIGYNFSI